MPIILRIILLIVISYVAIVLFFFFRQHRLLYMPKKQLSATPLEMGLPYREVFFKTPDGFRLCGWLTGDEREKEKRVILICHGNAGNISHRLETISIFHQLGLRVFIFDYRGYGKSEGEPSEEGTYLDAAAAWDYLVETEKIPGRRIILFGRSLGGAVVSHLAASPDIDAGALILESTFTSIPDAAAQLYPLLPVRLLARFDYNTLSRLPGIHLPILIIHSPQDELAPFSHAKRLLKAANEPKQFLQIAGSHNHGFLDSREIYMDGLKAFFRVYCR
ncbi:MAG: alpha/beta hydrolase [bacterium]|nr:alpha/beta hydrolase [bacterium]